MLQCRSSSPVSPTQRQSPSANWPPSDWRSARGIIRPSFLEASSSGLRSPAPWRPIRPSSSPTSRPAISTKQPEARSSSYCSAAGPSAAPHWFWSRTMPGWRRVAIACCICARDTSRRRRRQNRASDERPRMTVTVNSRSPLATPLATGWSAGFAGRFAWRDLRGGLRGFGVFIACIALGVLAIAGVGSVAASLADGVASAGQAILGGDLAFTLIQRESNDAERAFFDRRGTQSVIAMTRAMARTADGRSTLVEVKAVDTAYPLFGVVATDPPLPLPAL